MEQVRNLVDKKGKVLNRCCTKETLRPPHQSETISVIFKDSETFTKSVKWRTHFCVGLNIHQVWVHLKMKSFTEIGAIFTLSCTWIYTGLCGTFMFTNRNLVLINFVPRHTTYNINIKPGPIWSLSFACFCVSYVEVNEYKYYSFIYVFKYHDKRSIIPERCSSAMN